MKFRIDELVSPAQVQVAKLFECPICLGVLHEPVQTKCEHIFCAACIRRARNGVCPMCKTFNDDVDIRPLKDVNMPMYRMMGKIPVVCPFTTKQPEEGAPSSAKRPRLQSVCSWTGSYADLLEVHVGSCACAPVKCTHCSLEVRRGDLSSHEETCDHRYELCTICGDRVRPGEDHAQSAALTHVAILQVQLQEAKSNSASGTAVSAQLEDVSQKLTRLHSEVAKCAKTAHVTQKISELRSVLRKGDVFVIDVKGVDKLLREYPVGADWMTPASPGVPLRVSIYPNGHRGSRPGHYGFFVEFPGTPSDLNHQVLCSVGSRSGTLATTGAASYGIPSFGLTSQLRDEAVDDLLKVKLTIVEVERLLAVDV